MPFTPVTVTKLWERADGTVPTGMVIFDLSEQMTDTSTGESVAPATRLSQLVAGRISVTLEANDDPTTVPGGAFYYVTERVDGAPEESYQVVVPHTAPAGTCTLASLLDGP